MVLREFILCFQLNQQVEIKSSSYFSAHCLETDALDCCIFLQSFFFFCLRIIDFTFLLVEGKTNEL